MKRVLLTAAVLATVLTGCATDPKKISAAYVSPTKYRPFDCDQLATESEHIERRSIELFHSMKKEADADKWQMGVGLILFWPVLFALEGGDGPEAAEYSRLKGEYEAVRVSSVEKKCEFSQSRDLNEAVKAGAAPT